MKLEDSSYPADWLRIAEKDWIRVKHLLDVRDPEAAGFYLQQSAEKFMKAFLLTKGWKLQKIHDLEKLLNMVFHRVLQAESKYGKSYHIANRPHQILRPSARLRTGRRRAGGAI